MFQVFSRKPYFLINFAQGVCAGVDLKLDTERSPRLDDALDAGIIHLSYAGKIRHTGPGEATHHGMFYI